MNYWKTILCIFFFFSMSYINAQTDEVIEVPYLVRTNIFDRTHAKISISNENEVIIVMRISGITIEEAMGNDPLFLEKNSVRYDYYDRECSATRTYYKDGEPYLTIAPCIIFTFIIPKEITTLNLVVSDYSPIELVMPNEILEELSGFDVL